MYKLCRIIKYLIHLIEEANGTQMKNSVEEVLIHFPIEIKSEIAKYENLFNSIEEIRLRTNRNILLKIGQEEIKLEYVVNTESILEILQRICDNSIYTYQNQICNGYITIKGGHRVRNIWKCCNERGTSY